MFKTLTALVLFTLSFIPVVLAQEPASSSATSTTKLNNDYFYQLEQYRQTHDQFILDRGEHTKFGTLATGEKLVASARAFASARARVLSAYLFALRVTLDQTEGVDIGDKQSVLTMIDQSAAGLAAHQQALAAIAERAPLEVELSRFETFDLPPFFAASYQSLSLLAIGRIQGSADQLLVESRNFESQVVTLEENEAKKASLSRGLKEIALKLQDATTSIAAARADFAEYNSAKQSDDPEDIHGNVIKALDPAYTALQQGVTYLVELEKTSQ